MVWRQRAWTRSRRSPCSTWTRARSPTRSRPRAVPSTARSARTGRSPRLRASGSTSRCGRCRRRTSSPRPGGPARHRSPTPTSSRPCSSSTRWTRGSWRARPGCGTCSSPTATRRPRRSASWPPSWTPRTWTSRASTTRFYRRLCGARLAHVLAAIVALREAGVWLEITTLVIPGLNDGSEELRSLARWIVETLGPGTPWHVSRFFPAYRLTDVPSTPHETLRRAADIGRDAGLRHVYVGNAPELGLEDTRCPACDAMLVQRRGYRSRSFLGSGGTCPRCRRQLEGRWRDAGSLGSSPADVPRREAAAR